MIIGIDPGLSGGIAWIDRRGSWIDPCTSGAMPMPVVDHRPDLRRISELFMNFEPETVCIEMASIRPGESGTSSFTIGLNYGMLIGQFMERGLSVIEVRAHAWKLKMGVARSSKEQTPKQLKEVSIGMALKLFPGVSLKASDRCKNYHDGMAEALLLAEYARRLKSGNAA